MTLKRPWLMLILILVMGIFLRVMLSRDPFLHKWDERYHALVAKNMRNAPFKPTLYKNPVLPYDYKDWSSNHIWLHKQPLPLWLISYSYKLFGVSEFNTRIPSIILSSTAILIIFFLTRMLYDTKTGLLAAFFLSINGLVVEMTSGRIATDHYDTLYMSFILFSVYASLHNAKTNTFISLFFAGFFLGCAILTKWLPALVILPVHFFFLLHYGRSAKTALLSVLKNFLIAAIISLPWQIYILSKFPLEAKWEYFHNWLHLTKELDGQTGGVFYFLNQIRINYSEIIYLPLIYLAYKLWKDKFRNYKYVAIAIWIFIPLIFFSVAKTKMQGYTLFIAPAFFIVTADFFYYMLDIKKNQKVPWKNFASVLLLISIIILPVRYCFERTEFGFRKITPEPFQIKYKSLNHDFDSLDVVLNVKEPIDFMFYHDCSAYSLDSISGDKLNRPIFKYKEQSNTLEQQ